MSVLNREQNLVINPALGGTALWRFACGYSPKDMEAQHAPLPLLFIALPIVLNERFRDIVLGTQKSRGLSAFAEKFYLTKFKEVEKDEIAAISRGVPQYRKFTLNSIAVAIRTNLISLDADTARILPMHHNNIKNIPKSVKDILDASEKLGIWCRGTDLAAVQNLLSVSL